MYKKNDKLELTITGLGVNGEGVGKDAGGFTFFVPLALPGERVWIQAVKLSKSYGYGKLLRIIERSPERAEPSCEAFGKCGGCELQHLNYAGQQKYKARNLSDCLKRIGGIETEISPIAACANEYGFRNKAILPIVKQGGETKIGFYAKRSHRVVECGECAIEAYPHSAVTDRLKAFIETRGISVYDEETGRGLVRRVLIRYAETRRELMVCLVVNGDKLPFEDEFIETMEGIDGLASLYLNINKTRGNAVLGDDCRLLHGIPAITETVCGLSFRVSPLSFFQTNSRGAELLFSKLLDMAGFKGGETVLDAYSGTGVIGLITAGRVKKVIGVELNPQAVKDAWQNAALNDISNAEFICGDVPLVVPSLPDKPDVIIADPPRKGLEPEFVNFILESGVPRLIYVSCDPATLARDIKLLARDYAVKAVQPIDMFPQTAHVETIAVLERDINNNGIR